MSYVLDPAIVDICFEEAEKGLKNNEVPVGCVFLLETESEQQIIAKAHNRTNEFKSALKHAEIECINQVVDKYPDSYYDIFKRTVVILTLEPCIMCCRMLRRLKVKAVLFGARNERFGGAGSVLAVHTDSRITDAVLSCQPGALDTARAISLLQAFYDQTNENAPKNKINQTC